MKNYNIDIIRLKNKINQDNSQDTLILRTIFNSVISKYPDITWLNILDNFFLNIPSYSDKDIMIYTILSYKVSSFSKLDSFFQKELIYSLITSNVTDFNLVKYTNILLKEDIISKVIMGYQKYLIKPHYIFKLIISNIYDKELTKLIDKFIKEHEVSLFRGNYNFFNIYHSLKNLINLDYYKEDISVLEIIPYFEEFDDSTKELIKKEFQRIEESDKTLMEKIEDSITLIARFSYELPMYSHKR